jgi:hypothetical protein
MVHSDPIIHIISPPGREDLADAANAERASQFEAWDMLSGRVAEPELGGHPKYLDIVGVNYYHSNQWEYLTNDRLHWHLKGCRRAPSGTSWRRSICVTKVLCSSRKRAMSGSGGDIGSRRLLKRYAARGKVECPSLRRCHMSVPDHR